MDIDRHVVVSVLVVAWCTSVMRYCLITPLGYVGWRQVREIERELGTPLTLRGTDGANKINRICHGGSSVLKSYQPASIVRFE